MEWVLSFRGLVGSAEPKHLLILIVIVHHLSVHVVPHGVSACEGAARWQAATEHEVICKFWDCGQLLKCLHESFMCLHLFVCEVMALCRITYTMGYCNCLEKSK